MITLTSPEPCPIAEVIGPMLIDGLSLLLSEKPFEKITVKEVVEASKVGRTTFYRSFDEIRDILIYEYDNLLKELAVCIVDYITNSACYIINIEKSIESAKSSSACAVSPNKLIFTKELGKSANIVELCSLEMMRTATPLAVS